MKTWLVSIGENQCDWDSMTVQASSREEAWLMVERSLMGTFYSVIAVTEV